MANPKDTVVDILLLSFTSGKTTFTWRKKYVPLYLGLMMGQKIFWDSKLYHEQCIGEQNFPPQNISLTRGLF